MPRLSAWRLVALVLACAALVLLYNTRLTSPTKPRDFRYTETHRLALAVETNTTTESFASKSNKKVDRIVLSLVACDQRLNESLNVIKSVLLFTATPIYFVIFADDNLLPRFDSQLSRWRTLKNGTFDFELQRINFPEKHREEWMYLFNKCAAQRLFIPSLASHIDSLIYLDTDTLFLGPADELWGYFRKFNGSQMAALALEDENPNVSWYPRFAKHPFYGRVGLNSGVMLMNLTRMRNFHWVDYVTPIMLKWKLVIPWGDQDIINVIFHYHGRCVLELPCRYNYRSDQCMYGDACVDATANGAAVLHASRRAFHSRKQPAFQAMYRAMDEYELGTDPRESVLPNLQRYFDEAAVSNCGNLRTAFLKLPVSTIHSMYGQPNR